MMIRSSRARPEVPQVILSCVSDRAQVMGWEHGLKSLSSSHYRHCLYTPTTLPCIFSFFLKKRTGPKVALALSIHNKQQVGILSIHNKQQGWHWHAAPHLISSHDAPHLISSHHFSCVAALKNCNFPVKSLISQAFLGSLSRWMIITMNDILAWKYLPWPATMP